MKSSGTLCSETVDVTSADALNVYCAIKRIEEELRKGGSPCSVVIPGYLDLSQVLFIFSVRMWCEDEPRRGFLRRARHFFTPPRLVTKLKIEYAKVNQ